MPPASSSLRSKWSVLALLAMAQFVVVLDASIVNVALPTIGLKLDIPRENLSWVVNAYILVFGGFLLLGGRLADLLGPRRMFLNGMLLFGAASLAGGFAQNEAMLIVARLVQGLGAALISPAALSIVTRTFSEGKERNTALGVWGAVAGSGGAAGVLLGGMLTEYLSWRWVLFVNVPIAVVVAGLAPRLLEEFRTEREGRHFDVAGAVVGDRRARPARLHPGRRRERRMGLHADARADPRGTAAARRVRRDRASPARSARALRDLPAEDAAGGEHRRPARRACRSSRCSTSSRCTCISSWASSRWTPDSPTCRWRS